jgi:tetratricopeptide (TPR) repeat protein
VLSAVVVFATLLLNCAALHAQAPAELIAKGDSFDQHHEADEALKYYLPVEKADPKNVPLLLKIARQYRHLMAAAGKQEEKMRLGNKALEYAERAAALAPNDSEAQLSVAITHGKMIPFLGSKEQMQGSRKVKEGAERAIKLDPRNDLAWHTLGRWHLVMAEVGVLKRALAQLVYGKMPNASLETAARCFEKAIALNPNRLMHHIELGRTYAAMGRKAEARKYIQQGLAMRSVEHDDPEIKSKGREILATLR